MASSCKKGYYFCNSSQKCKRIPRGHKVLGNGELVREYVSDWRSDLQEEEPKKSLSDRSFKKLEKRAKNFKLDSQEDQDQYALEVNRRMTKVGKDYYTVNRKTDQKNRRGRTVGHNRGIKDHNEELQGGVSVEPYTKDTKFLEVETVDIIKPKALNASDWRSELEVVNEGVKYYTGSDRNPNTGLPKGLKSGGGTTAGSDPIEVLKRMRDLGGASAKKTVDPKKNEVISASYEAALNDLVVEVLKYDIEDLHNSGFSYEEIAEYYDVKDEVLSEAPAPLVSAGVKILQKVAPKVTKFIANRAVKDSKKVVNWARKPGNWKALNKNIDKVTLPVGKALKQLPARTYAAGQNFRKAVDATYNAGKALRGSTTNALSSARKNLLPAAKGGLKNVTGAGQRFSNFVDKAYSSLEKNVGQKLINRGRQDIAIRNLDKAKINKTKEVFAKVKKLEKKGDVAGDVIDVTNTTKGTGYKRPGSPWYQFMKKRQPQRGIPNPPVDRTNKLLNPAGGAITAIKDKGSALVAKVRNFFSKKGTKQLTGTKAPNKLSGTTVAGALPSGSSKGTKSPLDKRAYSRQWMGLQKAADATVKADKASAIARTSAAGLLGLTAGGKVGQEIGKKLNNKKVDASSQSQVSPPPLEQPKVEIPKVKKNTVVPKNKTIKDTEKKTVDPKKNEVVTKTTTKKTSTKPKGRTKWVGVNSTWVDRHGNVIAPRMKKTTKSKKGILTPLEQELED